MTPSIGLSEARRPYASPREAERSKAGARSAPGEGKQGFKHGAGVPCARTLSRRPSVGGLSRCAGEAIGRCRGRRMGVPVSGRESRSGPANEDLGNDERCAGEAIRPLPRPKNGSPCVGTRVPLGTCEQRVTMRLRGARGRNARASAGRSLSAYALPPTATAVEPSGPGEDAAIHVMNDDHSQRE